MRNNIVLLASTCIFFLSPIIALADQGNEENWSLHYQATVIGQGDLKFHSPYSGQNSLNPGETSETVTTTFFLGVRIWKGGELYFNPEISQGKGLSDTLGVAGFPNGEGSRCQWERKGYQKWE